MTSALPATLFTPFRFGDIHVANRVVMAPLTRNRAPGAVPTAAMVTYYTQRADPVNGAGLIVTEATAITHQGQGYADVPGIWCAEQVAGWRKVTDAVHAAGGKIAVQLWHVGRVSHVELQPGGGAPVAPSAITAKTKTVLIKDGGASFFETSPPRALRVVGGHQCGGDGARRAVARERGHDHAVGKMQTADLQGIEQRGHEFPGSRMVVGHVKTGVTSQR